MPFSLPSSETPRAQPAILFPPVCPAAFPYAARKAALPGVKFSLSPEEKSTRRLLFPRISIISSEGTIFPSFVPKPSSSSQTLHPKKSICSIAIASAARETREVSLSDNGRKGLSAGICAASRISSVILQTFSFILFSSFLSAKYASACSQLTSPLYCAVI